MIKKVVCVLAPMLGIRGDIKSVFSTNAIFATSKTVDTLKNCTDLWKSVGLFTNTACHRQA